MPPQLCSVCQSIPPRIWAQKYDQVETCQEIYVELQTLGNVKAASAKGCQLCTLLIHCPLNTRTQDMIARGKKEMCYLRRSIACPDRAVRMCVGPHGNTSLSETFFYRIPSEWILPRRRIKNLQMTGVDDSWTPRPTSLNQTVNNLELMTNWLRMCKENHHECSKPTSSFLPTRLIDVRAFKNNKDVRLVESAAIVKEHYMLPPYLTLSHCWGKTNLITTTGATVRSRKDRIAFVELSQTFRDAVELTRQLDQRYLWIDSLCIVQDDEDDWAREAARMAKVYGNSLCTLAALSSADGRGGCHLEADIQRSLNNRFFDYVTSLEDPGVRLFPKEPTDWTADYNGTKDGQEQMTSPLRYRAWVLQERELSRRSIHFGKNQLLWECKEIKGSAQLPWRETQRKSGLKHTPEWFRLIEDYTLRGLTKSSDKLPAVAGVADENQVHNGHYLAGLWSNQFPAALMWQSMDPYAKRHEAYRAPSWSWASIKGQVSYDTQRLVAPSLNFQFDQWRDNPSCMVDGVYKGLYLQDASCKPTHPSNVYGGIKEGAYVSLKDVRLLEIDAPMQTSTSKRRGPKMESEHLCKSGKQMGVFYRDTLDERSEHGTVYLLVLQEESIFPLVEHPWQLHQKRHMIDTVMGIVVTRAEGRSKAFRRLGLGRWVDDRLLAHCKPQDVVLV
ncbi:hypothetical protein B5807_07841 [Epicoccum nigrum]|uniref:Heterokaryon incompatibility domain-containing protein n=1 Tax=Epicoccum nigrum TaxID=105696 RepID=A0A1Y2LWI6_EPING|nr:hypothetical protein B5807_07841 [Epicoccum nigrum]